MLFPNNDFATQYEAECLDKELDRINAKLDAGESVNVPDDYYDYYSQQDCGEAEDDFLG